jgi:hypothetical protein
MDESVSYVIGLVVIYFLIKKNLFKKENKLSFRKRYDLRKKKNDKN